MARFVKRNLLTAYFPLLLLRQRSNARTFLDFKVTSSANNLLYSSANPTVIANMYNNFNLLLSLLFISKMRFLNPTVLSSHLFLLYRTFAIYKYTLIYRLLKIHSRHTRIITSLSTSLSLSFLHVSRECLLLFNKIRNIGNLEYKQ